MNKNFSLAGLLSLSLLIVAACGGSGDDEPAGPTAQQRAQDLLAQMTIDEKVNMMHGEFNSSYGFYNNPIERLGIPALTMADGPSGVRVSNPNVNGGRATQLPSGAALGATWDVNVAEQYGDLAGNEAFSTGHNVLLGPVLDIARNPLWGRVGEGYGEDPLLTGAIGTAFIRGVQRSPVMTSVKHFLGYTQETNRLNASNMVIDERTLQEIYARPVATAVREANPGSVMCAFNQVNAVYACENDLLLNQMLKTQLGFEGFVMTDYNTTFETVPAALAGLDQDMPGNFTPQVGPGDCRFCGPLLEAVRSGQVPESRVDDAVLRMLRSMYRDGLFDNPPTIKPFPEQEHGALAREISEQGTVLLKNDANTLPLRNVASIAVIGSDADVLVAMGGSGGVNNPTYAVSPLDGVRARAGAGASVQHVRGSDPVTAAALLPGPNPVPSDFLTPPSGEGNGLRAEYFLNPDFSGTPEFDRVDPYAAINGGFFIYDGLGAGSPRFPKQPASLNGTTSIRWTGQLAAPVAGSYELAATSNATSRLFVDGNLVLTTSRAGQPYVANTTTTSLQFEAGSVHDIRIEFVNDGPSGTDTGPQYQFGWTPPSGVVAAQAQQAAELARNSDVALVFVRDYGGEGGDKASLELPNGQAEVIRQVAAANPRTIVVLVAAGGVQVSDWEASVPSILHSWYGGQEQGNAIARLLFGDVNPSGKLPLTLPVDAAHTPVSTAQQFPGVNKNSQFSEGIFVGYRGYEQLGLQPSYPFGHGLSYTTFTYANLRATPTSVTVNVTNSGQVAGKEVVQVYAGALPVALPTAAKSLAGFAKVALQPGESQDVTIALDPHSMSYWDVDADGWVAPAGLVPIMVGASSADIRLEGTVQQAAAGPSP